MDPRREHDIVFSGLKDGEHRFTFELGPDFFASAADEELEGGAVQVAVTLDKAPGTLVLDLSAQGSVSLHCDHCNGLMDFPIEGGQRQIFHLNGRQRFEEENDEVVGLDPQDTTIHLTHYFYECIRLALPIRRVHPAGQCDPETDRALKERATEHEPVPDPRWAVLKDLKKNPRATR